MKKSILLALAALSFNSCAEEPTAAVSQLLGGGSGGSSTIVAGDEITKTSLTYVGSDLFGQSCSLSLTINEAEEEAFFVNLDYTLHGQEMPSVEGHMYKYNFGTNSYSDAHTGNGELVIAGALLKSEQELDINSLAQYEQTGDLQFSLRVDFNSGSDEHDFEHALEEVLADSTKLAAHKDDLNIISRAVFKIGHVGHYDASACLGLQISKVETITYEISHDDDHADHDGHDHGDHDGHDHGDHDEDHDEDEDHDDHDGHDHGDHDEDHDEDEDHDDHEGHDHDHHGHNH